MRERLRTPEIVRPIKKLFIANRGEIAVRATRTCRMRGIPVVIPYSFSDDRSLATRLGDENQGNGWELAALGGTSQDENYANPQVVLDAIRLHGCDAVFLGYGFLAENVEFVRECEQTGVRVLAPRSQIMDITGNKVKAREIAGDVKIGPFATIPVLEGTPLLTKFDDVASAVERLGFPVLVKDPDAGGGSGNLVAGNKQELETAFIELRRRSGNQGIFLERYISNAVHVEVQIAADQHGGVVSLGERDCTMQRNYQKIVEESPSPHVSGRMRDIIQRAAINFARKIGYNGVGTWEFVVDLDRKGRGEDPAWYFMEINPRIQVEHPVTEEQTGADIVGLMIDIAEGKRLPFSQAHIRPRGHTIEVRVYAENPNRNFEEDSGVLELLRLPDVQGVRVDTGYEEGDEVSLWFDKTLLKLIAHGETREEARFKLVQSLSQMEIVGVATNQELLLNLLDTSEFRNAKGTTTFIEKWWKKRLRDRVHAISEFINDGTFVPYESSHHLDTALLPQNVLTPSRSSETASSYSGYLERQKTKTGKECAAQYGILERNGIQFVSYILDYEFNAGTLGVAEGLAFQDACRLAYERHLPLITISTSGGARQQENTLALFMMSATVEALSRFPPPLHINVYTGPVYGGVPASFAGVADIQIAVDSQDTKLGFTGPYIVARSMGLQPSTFDAGEIYERILPEGTHTPLHHFQSRNVHLLVHSLGEASDRITHVLHLLRLPSTITDPHLVYRPKESIGFRQTSAQARRFDLPSDMRRRGWIARKFGVLWERNKSRSSGEVVLSSSYESISPAERLKVIDHIDRPTAADLIDTKAGVFEDAALLSDAIVVSGAEQFPPIIAAFATLEGKPMLVLGQQTQRKGDEDTKEQVKAYDPQRPEDWEYMEQMLATAKNLRLPVVLFGDTEGGDCLPESEDRNQSHKIARILKLVNEYPYPVISVNIGMKGSGGGETFIRPCDAAADFENAMSFVSAPMVQYWILTGKWIDGESPEEQQQELRGFIEQLYDATAEGRLATHQIDTIIPEGKGGAHVDPRVAASSLHSWLIEQLRFLQGLSQEQLLERRRGRIDKVMKHAAVPANTTDT